MAAREVRERIRGRIFRVGTVLILLVVAAAIVVPVVNRSSSHPHRIVGVVGALSASLRATVVASGPHVGTTVRLVPEADAADRQSRSAIRPRRSRDHRRTPARGEEGDQRDRHLDNGATRRALVSSNLGVAEAFEAAGLSAAQAPSSRRAKALPVVSVEPGAAKGATQSTSVIGLILTFVMLTQYSTWT